MFKKINQASTIGYSIHRLLVYTTLVLPKSRNGSQEKSLGSIIAFICDMIDSRPTSCGGCQGGLDKLASTSGDSPICIGLIGYAASVFYISYEYMSVYCCCRIGRGLNIYVTAT